MNEHITQKEWNHWMSSYLLSVNHSSSSTLTTSSHDDNGDNDDNDDNDDDNDDHVLWLDDLKEACKCSKIQTQTLSSSSQTIINIDSNANTKSVLVVGLFYQVLSYSSLSPCIQAITCLSKKECQLLQQWGYCIKPFYWLQFIQSIDEM